MRMSRPVSVLILMGIMVTGAAWYAPPRNETAQVAVMLPGELYKLLVLKGEAGVNATRHPRSVVQVIEELAKR